MYIISALAQPVIFLENCVKHVLKLTNLIFLVLDSASFYKKPFFIWKVKVYIWRITFWTDEKS